MNLFSAPESAEERCDPCLSPVRRGLAILHTQAWCAEPGLMDRVVLWALRDVGIVEPDPDVCESAP